MKKKTVKKLVLAKETIALISEAGMRGVRGGDRPGLTDDGKCLSLQFVEKPCDDSAVC